MIRCTTVGVEPSLECYEICLLSSRCEALKEWEREQEVPDEEEVYVLTPYGVLLAVMDDYNINIDHLTPKMAEHLFEDFMEVLMKQGYVSRVDGIDEG